MAVSADVMTMLPGAAPAQGPTYPSRPITLVVGEPLFFTEADLAGGEGRELYQRLSERVMERITAIQFERP